MLAALQDAGPSATGWYAILGVMGSGMGIVFGALMLEMRTRRERAEKLVDTATEDARKATAVLADLTMAVREQTGAVKQMSESIAKNREALDSVSRQLEDVRRTRG